MRALRHLGLSGCVFLAGSAPSAFGHADAIARAGSSYPAYLITCTDEGELDALTSKRFTAALTARNVVLTTYRELIGKEGLKAMRRPAG